MGLKKLLFILLMLVMSICGRVNAITAPTGSPTDDRECVVHRATLEHPVEGTGAEAFIRLDHTAEIIFNVSTGGQKIQFDCINKGIQDYAYCRVHFGEKHLGNMVLQRKTWQRLSVSESRLTLETVGGALRIQELTLKSGKMDLSKGLVYTVQSKSGGLLLRFCEAGCVYMQTPFENDLYLTQRLETQQDFWIWNANETAKAEVKLTFKMSETSVSHGSLDLNVAKKDVWQQFTLSQSSEADLIQLKDVASGNLISKVAKTERGAEVSFYCDSSDKVYWSLGCDASFSGSSTTLTTVYFSAGAVVLIIVVVVGVHLHHRRFTPAESPSSGTGDSPFETVFLTRIDLPVSTSASGTHQGHAVGETLTGEEPGSIPHAPSRRREVLSQQATQAEIRSPQRRRMRNVEMSMAVPGEERDFSEGNEIDISRGTNGHGARNVNWVGDTDKEVKCTRTPTNTLWNQTATRFPEEIDNPVCLSHGNNTDRDNSVSNTAPQERAQKPGNVRPRRTERMPSDVMRELSGNVLKMAKASAATELKKTPRQSPPLKDSQETDWRCVTGQNQSENAGSPPSNNTPASPEAREKTRERVPVLPQVSQS